MKRVVDVRLLHKPLLDAGLVPPNCRLMSMQVGTSGGLVVVYEVFITGEQLATLGQVFQMVSDQMTEGVPPMVALNIILDGTQQASGPPFDPSTALHLMGPVTVIGMPNGTAAGKPTVILRAKLADGRDVFIETTMALFVTAARAFVGRYGEP